MRGFMSRFVKDESGAAAVEYGLLVAAIAAIIIVTVFFLGGYVEGAFKTTCNSFKTAGNISNANTSGSC